MPGDTSAVPQNDLQRLLATERRLADRLAAARAERDRVIAAAETAAQAREAALAADLESAEGRLREALAAEQRQREQEIARAAEREVAAYEAVPQSRLAEIVQLLQRRLLDEERAP
jgi:prophage DNA circulation protein